MKRKYEKKEGGEKKKKLNIHNTILFPSRQGGTDKVSRNMKELRLH